MQEMNPFELLRGVTLEFHKHGIESYIVGGYVRDRQLGRQSDDVDVCLVGVKDWKLVTEILRAHSSKLAADVGIEKSLQICSQAKRVF